MLRIFKYLLLVPTVVLLGFIVAEKLDLAGTAHHIMGVDAAAVGAVPNPDWESINPIGCRYRFNLGPGEFARLQQEQLPQLPEQPEASGQPTHWTPFPFCLRI